MTPDPQHQDIIGIVKELQKFHQELWKHTPSDKRAKWNKNVTNAFPAMTKALLIAIEGLEELQYDSVARDYLARIRSLHVSFPNGPPAFFE